MSNFQKDLTRGSVVKQLLSFSLPFLAANFLQAMYNMADMLIVGRFNGMAGAGAVGGGGQVTILVINLISGLAVGSTVLIAQYLGAGRPEEMKRTVGTTFTLYAIAGAALTVIMLLVNPLLLRLLVDDPNKPELYSEALAYTQICTGGTLFIFGYNAVSAILRGMGDSRHPLIFVGLAAGVNVLLDLLFVGVFKMGAAGAAWATVASQALSFIWSVMFLRGRDFVFDFKPKSFRIDRKIAGKLLKIGLPASLQGTLVAFSFMTLTGIANSLAGAVGNTAVSVAGKVNSVAILPAMAMSSSVASMAGQNLGAGKPERARHTMFVSIGITLAITAVMFALVQLFAPTVVRLFIQDEDLTADSLLQISAYLRSISWDYLIVAAVFNFNAIAMAAGQTWFTLLNSIISSLLARVPAAFLLGVTFHMGLAGLGYAAPIATLVSSITAGIYFLTGSWKKARLVEGAPLDMAY